MRDDFAKAVCGRIAQVRAELTGPRGRAAFAKLLGLAPSTYEYYETYRVPPADVLLRIAEVAKVDLQWLLSGRVAESQPPTAGDPVVARAAAMLSDNPQAAQALSAFVDILGAARQFPPKPAPAQAPSQPSPPPQAVPCDPPATVEPADAWIPILGRTAAGLPQFWRSASDAAATTGWDDLIARHARRSRRTAAAVARLDNNQSQAAWLVTSTQAGADDVSEFIWASALRAKYPDAFALRVDGDSMSPDIRHGDVVVVSPSAPAVDAQAAVVQLTNQIGLTCKLLRRDGRRVHLVPINEQFPPQAFDAADVSWALRVLACVRAAEG
jgi:transcriptional regulator with XRE-family HTH domain